MGKLLLGVAGYLALLGTALALSYIVRPVEAQSSPPVGAVALTLRVDLQGSTYPGCNSTRDEPYHFQLLDFYDPTNYYDFSGVLDTCGEAGPFYVLGNHTYWIWVKTARTEADKFINWLPPSATTWELGTDGTGLLTGDSNNDNCVGAADYAIMHAAWSAVCNDPNYDHRADYNDDCIVNIGDFNYLHNNFSTCGDAPLFAEAK